MYEPSKLGMLFGEVSRKHSMRIHNAVLKLGVGRGMPPVLGYIVDNNGCKQSDISRLNRVTPATVTVMLQTLEKNGFIIRKTDEADQRCIRIYITDKGRDAALRSKEATDKADRELFSCLTSEEQREFLRILLKLKDKLEKEGKDAQ